MKKQDPQDLARREVDNQLPQIREDLAALKAFEINSLEDQEFAVDLIRELKVKHDGLEAVRTSITKPMNEALNAVNALFRPARQLLEEGEKILKQKISVYVAAREKENRLALQAAAEAQTVEEASAAISEVEVGGKVRGMSTSYKWRAEVFRPEMVPNEFLSPDMNKIEASMKASVEVSGEPMPIPGVRFHKEPVISVRRSA